MKFQFFVFLFLALLICCKRSSFNEDLVSKSNVAIANQFIDAFYSFNKDSLQSSLTHAEASQPNILYYQGWAECGNYKVLKRDNAFEKNDSLVIFPVTVKDDLMGSLQIDFNVTDTFKIVIREGQIHSVENSSNDPDEYYKAKEWVKQNHPEYVEKQCEGIWNGGPTPCECIKGMIKGFGDFVESKKAK